MVARNLNLSSGGIGRVPSALYEEYVRRGHSVSLVTCEGNSLLRYFTYASFEVPFRLPKADVYHAISPVEGIWVPKEKSVTTFLDLIVLERAEDIGIGLKGLSALLSKEYFKFASQVSLKSKRLACISEFTKSQILKFFGRKDVEVVRLGINKDLRPFYRRNGKLTLGYLGQLNPRKRVKELVREFHLSGVDAILRVAGSGLDENYIKGLSKCDHRIIIDGTIRDRDLCDWYNLLDVFVFPTKWEGYGLPIVEAMACCKPVVVMQDSIIPQELKDRCIKIKYLEELMDGYQIEKIKRADIVDNLQFAREHSWSKCANRYLELFEEVLKGG